MVPSDYHLKLDFEIDCQKPSPPLFLKTSISQPAGTISIKFQVPPCFFAVDPLSRNMGSPLLRRSAIEWRCVWPWRKSLILGKRSSSCLRDSLRIKLLRGDSLE